MSKYKVIIGRFEHIDVVNGSGVLENIPAKIDSGAYRSSIHVKDAKVIKKGRSKYLRFILLGHPIYGDELTVEAKKFKTIAVRSSNGHVTERYEVTLKIRLGYKVYSTSFTLSDRSENIFPVLIGRRALNGRYMIDPQNTGIVRAELKKAIKLPLDEEDLEGINT